jgi:imidazolonepropionase-like amidohydrolase
MAPFRVVSLTLAVGLGTSPALRGQEKPIVLRGGTVIPVSGPVIPNGTVVLRGGKIAAVGVNLPVPVGAEVVDVRGKYLMPGVVDAMSNIGVGGSDQDETVDPINPANRAVEAYNPFGDFGSGRPGPLRNREVLSGGVTTMYVGPADATLIGGQGVVVKTAGPDLASLVVREPAAMDMTLGTPPKTAARARNRDPATRMAEVAMLRQRLVRAQEYQRNREQNPAAPRDLGLDALGRLLRREFPARIQANHPTDIRSALRLAQEFGFDLVIDGGQGAAEFTSELVARRVPVILGQVSHPYVSNEEIPDKQDYPPMDERLPGRLTRAGVKTAIATFSRAFGSLAPAGSAKWLLIDAGIAAGYGMTEADVLKAVTLIPAEILGVADRIGSLEVGKDADVVVVDGPPLSVKSWVQRVYVNGELVFQK